MTELVKYDAMCRAIAEAHKIDEVKGIRDKAVALEHYARQAQNEELERQCREIRLRAERKAGQLLKSRDRPTRWNEGDPDAPSSLEDLGITKKQSSRWQDLADVPNDQFEGALSGDEMPSTSGIINSAFPKPVTPVSTDALWLWGRLLDFEDEKDGLLHKEPHDVLETMTDEMMNDTLELAPLVAAWLLRIPGDRH